MRIVKFMLFVLLAAGAMGTVKGQNEYVYHIDLNKTGNDVLEITADLPESGEPVVVFSFARIIPGTYRISDFGQFISGLKAFDRSGRPLQVRQLDINRWQISEALNLAKVVYSAEDIFDSDKKHAIYPMAATNIESGVNVVFNSPGFLGFIERKSYLPARVIFERPSQLYPSTSLIPVSQTKNRDEFAVHSVNELYDSPIMFSIPDTTTVKVGNCEVLISVYSPGKKIKSMQIAEWMTSLLEATRHYLRGRLPADRYAFLYYFKDEKLTHSFPVDMMGALEHPSSSFYYLPDIKAENIKQPLIDMSSHEFFHIITPLTIASREIKEFDFGTPVLSKHLWLYEGVTEYTSHHVQVRYGLKNQPDFLKELSNMLLRSKTKYNDSLPFTELSKGSAGKHASQYGNVYQKGALIAACLDIYLLHLSDGKYGLQDLMRELSLKYGKYRAFSDDDFFDEIAAMTYPEVREFFREYVEGAAPIPYERFFNMGGILYTPLFSEKIFSLGKASLAADSAGMYVYSIDNLDVFGKKLGFKKGDRVYAFNKILLTPKNAKDVLAGVKAGMKEGDWITVKIGRAGNAGRLDTLLLNARIEKVEAVQPHKLELMEDISLKQMAVRRAWLKPKPASASTAFQPPSPSSVSGVDTLLKAFYKVISGPVGPRDWNLFQSYFFPGAAMGSIHTLPGGQAVFEDISTGDYRWRCAPLFLQRGFYEEEIQRKVNQFGNIAVVESSYQFRFEPGGKVIQRGVNYFTVVRSAGRWWIQNLVWQGEDNNLQLSLN